MKKLNDWEMRDAIRGAYRKFGKDHPHAGIISWVRKTYGDKPSWQKVLGVKSRILDHEWRQWDDERAKTDKHDMMKTFDKTTEREGDEIVETYTPKENVIRTMPLPLPLPDDMAVQAIKKDVWEEQLVKQDTEIVAVLNLCVDWDKFHRFMTLSDMHRLNMIGQEQLGFDRNRIRFALVGGNGELRECSLS